MFREGTAVMVTIPATDIMAVMATMAIGKRKKLWKYRLPFKGNL
jgi:hypothetical protein